MVQPNEDQTDMAISPRRAACVDGEGGFKMEVASKGKFD